MRIAPPPFRVQKPCSKPLLHTVEENPMRRAQWIVEKMVCEAKSSFLMFLESFLPFSTVGRSQTPKELFECSFLLHEEDINVGGRLMLARRT